MNKKIVISLVVILVVAVGFIVFASLNNRNAETTNIDLNNEESFVEEENKVVEKEGEVEERELKEFVMESYTDIVSGEFFPSFSLKEIKVNKGDLVRIKITTTSGSHNFKIDEFNVFKETPLNEETIIEFVADKTGEFIYYCAKPNHRELGHWGTLIVSE